MTPRRLGATAAVLFLAAASGFALAARNSSGTYSLPSGNPVVSGTTISSQWANSTLSDLATETTNSLDRFGRGAMLAPLKAVDGTASAPGLTFSSEQTSGLYRASSGDVRLSALDTQVQQWTSAQTTISLPLTCSEGATVTQSVTNGNGLTVTGNGTGYGIKGTGGATSGDGIQGIGSGSGNGLKGIGGATNGFGVLGDGTGSGDGVRGVGGSSNGVGVHGIGQGDATGVFGEGNGIGAGVAGDASGTGPGVQGSGGSGSPGGVFFRGTGAGIVDAVQVNSSIAFVSASNPSSSTPYTNRITPTNIIKAWARVDCTAGACSITDGFNVSAVSTSATAVSLTLASTVAAAGGGGVFVTPTGSNFTQGIGSLTSGTNASISFRTPTGSTIAPNGASFTGGFNVLVLGAQ